MLVAMMLFVMTLMMCATSLPSHVSAQEEVRGKVMGEESVVSGTLEQLDLDHRKGLLRTPLGKPIFFEITKPELFRGISVGQLITIQLDDQGRALKAIETPSVPELPASTQ